MDLVVWIKYIKFDWYVVVLGQTVYA